MTKGLVFGACGFILGAIVVWLVVVILTRMYLELIAVIFRIAHNTTILAKQAESA